MTKHQRAINDQATMTNHDLARMTNEEAIGHWSFGHWCLIGHWDLVIAISVPGIWSLGFAFILHPAGGVRPRLACRNGRQSLEYGRALYVSPQRVVAGFCTPGCPLKRVHEREATKRAGAQGGRGPGGGCGDCPC